MKAVAIALLISLLEISQSRIDGHHLGNHPLSLRNVRHNKEPCQPHKNNENNKNNENSNAAQIFQKKHILQEPKPKNREEWGEYLKKKNLCGRVPIQSFILTSDVNNICQGQGIQHDKNKCISNNKYTVCDVISISYNKICWVFPRPCYELYVIVACDKIGNICLPVHYEGSTTGPPINVDRVCQ